MTFKFGFNGIRMISLDRLKLLPEISEKKDQNTQSNGYYDTGLQRPERWLKEVKCMHCVRLLSLIPAPHGNTGIKHQEAKSLGIWLSARVAWLTGVRLWVSFPAQPWMLSKILAFVPCICVPWHSHSVKSLVYHNLVCDHLNPVYDPENHNYTSNKGKEWGKGMNEIKKLLWISKINDLFVVIRSERGGVFTDWKNSKKIRINHEQICTTKLIIWMKRLQSLKQNNR